MGTYRASEFVFEVPQTGACACFTRHEAFERSRTVVEVKIELCQGPWT